jgi:hypothetical protein
VSTPLRTQANDPEVLARTGEALEIAATLGKPPLRLHCNECRGLLARVGDIPGYGALFVSSWEVPAPPSLDVTVNGRKLRRRELRRWVAENYETISQSGEPIDAPLRDAVIALLALPATMTQDYPDLLMRCDRGHGDYVADRHQVLALLRRAVATGTTLDDPVPVKPVKLEYLAPSTPMPGGVKSTRHTVRKFKPFSARHDTPN